MTTEHSILPPSSAARRVVCPASRALEAQFALPILDTTAIDEGQLAHKMAASLLKGETHVEIEDEMLEYVNFYVDYILSYRYKATTHSQSHHTSPLFIEEKVNITNIHPECWGTPDAWFYDPYTAAIHLFDLKYGFSNIEAYENWQLIEYAAGIINSLLSCPKNTQVQFHIIQPRLFRDEDRVKTWTISVKDLQPYFDKLRKAENNAMSSNPWTKVSEQCFNCKARYACDLFKNTVLNSLDLVYQSQGHISTNDGLSKELSALIDAKKIIDARITGLEQQAICKLRDGESIPGFNLAQQQKREIWTVGIDEIQSLGSIYGANLLKPQEAITPAQARKLLKPEIIAQYSTRPPGEMRLEQIDQNKVKRIFDANRT